MRRKRRREFNIPSSCRDSNVVVDVVMFGFEVDTLEIRLMESDGVVNNTVLIESEFDHHGHAKKCIFRDILRSSIRFKRFSVVSICLSDKLNRQWQPIDWNFETHQQNAASHVVAKLPPKTIVTFGHVDEVPNRDVWLRIAKCQGDLPTNVAITNLHGHAQYESPSIYSAKGYPYTLGSPAVMWASKFHAVHPRGMYNQVWLRGGAHMTNYCYAGNRILKEWTATEARPDQMQRIQPSCTSQIQGCRRASYVNSRKLLHAKSVPIALRCNPLRYPEWWHRDDPRLHSTVEKTVHYNQLSREL
jgi:hypothetical protein